MTDPGTEASRSSRRWCDHSAILLIVPARTLRAEVYTLQISDNLLCLFNAEVVGEGDKYYIELPAQEIETDTLEAGETYRVAIISRDDGPSATEGGETERGRPPSEPQPPVDVGEIRYVEIEDIGKQGDGIARVERGYVIIVPGAEVGEQVKIEVSEVKSNFAVGEIIEETL